jgi:hypothetical protein
VQLGCKRTVSAGEEVIAGILRRFYNRLVNGKCFVRMYGANGVHETKVTGLLWNLFPASSFVIVWKQISVFQKACSELLL